MLLKADKKTQRVILTDATAMPRASGFLWNRKMMIQANCRGFAVAQHMQPEPSKYAYAPNLEARTFMQPEQPYYAHHPGRFVYIRDDETGALFSAPHEPVRQQTERFEFSVGQNDIQWCMEVGGIEVHMTLSLPTDTAIELWHVRVRNSSGRSRKLSIYPFFSIGFMSWMNQSARYRQDLGGIVASCITPYQKVEDYPLIKTLKDKTFFLHEKTPDSWETILENFEGEGGLQRPDALRNEQLSKGESDYEMPAAILQYRASLAVNEEKDYRFIFGPAKNDDEIRQLRKQFLNPAGFETAADTYATYIESGAGCVEIKTPDAGLDQFVNHWLARQVFYHGDVNRLCTDPQTRNYLQDAMGMVYIQPAVARKALLKALSQQKPDGAMPDGIRLTDDAELKYINQVPHTDHCVWLAVFLEAYLDETADYPLLKESVSAEDGSVLTVAERMTAAMRWLISDRDQRGLNYIAQGDWCDPMNMVGHKGKGVSAWLSVATVYALKLWAGICTTVHKEPLAKELLESADEIAAAVQTHLWDGDWFARGITDDNIVFGVSTDSEGRIFLNPQSWAMLADIASESQSHKMVKAIDEQLLSPYGVQMLAPAYTAMREDVGRVTQKFPGSAENGSVYNHAAAFYGFALYQKGYSDRAWQVMRRMLPGTDEKDLLRRGQLPVYIPNYYRGAWQQFPRTAGRSSQLFNTGTASWFYRIIIEQLFGVKGCADGLQIDPKLPSDWPSASITRNFRGARFHIQFKRQAVTAETVIRVNGKHLDGNIFSQFEAGNSYQLDVQIGTNAQQG